MPRCRAVAVRWAKDSAYPDPTLPPTLKYRNSVKLNIYAFRKCGSIELHSDPVNCSGSCVVSPYKTTHNSCIASCTMQHDMTGSQPPVSRQIASCRSNTVQVCSVEMGVHGSHSAPHDAR